MAVRWNTWRSAAGMALLGVALTACMGGSHRRVDAMAASPAAERPIVFSQQGHASPRPTVVFQSGLGDDHGAWAQVLAQLPRDIEAVAPDRPGYGASPAREQVRDACRIASEQRQMLRSAGLQPPYLLVGHSLGGLYQYAYARLYPDEVAGLVLLEPTHPQILPTMQRDAPAAAALLQLARHTVFTPVMQQEFDAQSVCLDTLDHSRPLAMPALLLVATRPAFYESADLRATLGTLRQDWLQLLGRTAMTPVADAGLHIQRDAPQAVVAAIESLVLRTSAPARAAALATGPAQPGLRAKSGAAEGQPEEPVSMAGS